MPEPEDHSMPGVSTEPQRQALDAMSRQLVARLNEMVREQHERAARFAATQHSLSPLPGMPESAPAPTDAAEEEEHEMPLPEPPPPATAEKKRKFPFLPQRAAAPKKPQDFAAPALSGSLLTPHAPKEAEPSPFLTPFATKKAKAEKSEESGCGTFPTLVFIIILVIIIRSCS